MSNAGCQNSTIKIIDFGNNPSADFTWSNECFGMGSSQFTNLSSGNNIINYEWDFGDGSTSNAIDPIHQYTSVANYPVSLIISTLNSCTDTARYTVYVRPYVLDYPYSQDFELGTGGWVAEALDSINSWELGIPNGSIINTAASGSNAWITGLQADYNNNENSAVVGPCFDFSGFEKPMISIKTWSITRDSLDGAVLQTSIDDGNTWQNAGSVDGGINWFNGYSIKGNPGGQQQGWTGNADTTWIDSRLDLNYLIGETNVRFRIAFGSDANYSNEGFAFDDIWIGERKRKVVVESFSNASDLKSWTTEINIQNISTAFPYDAIPIFYHTNTLGNDVFYSSNPDIPDALSLHYGISGNPYTVMDGISHFNYINTNWTAADLILRALDEPKFDLIVNSQINQNDTINELWLDAKLTSKVLINSEVIMQVLIVENVNGIVVGANGQSSFSNVVRDMAPDAAGTLFMHKWAVNQEDSVSIKHILPTFYSPNDYSIIVYVQDVLTKEIYQSEVIDYSSIPTDLADIDNLPNLQISLYPNPAFDYIRIKIPKINADANVIISDNFGKTQQIIPIYANTQLIDLNLNNYRGGIYFVQYRSKTGIILSQKFIKK